MHYKCEMDNSIHDTHKVRVNPLMHLMIEEKPFK